MENVLNVTNMNNKNTIYVSKNARIYTVWPKTNFGITWNMPKLSTQMWLKAQKDITV